jgi:transcription antitermination factor NusG
MSSPSSPNAVDVSSAQWFVLAIKPRHEKLVAHLLGCKGYENFLPLQKRKRQYGTRNRESELPLFPGYVFCRFQPQKRLPILITPGINHIVGSGRNPIPVADCEIVALQTAVSNGLDIQPCPFLQAGERVLITKGALSGLAGIVVRVTAGLQVVLSITILRRSVLVKLDPQWLIPQMVQSDEAGQKDKPSSDNSLSDCFSEQTAIVA